MALRILLTTPVPLAERPSGQEVLRLARGLVRWGHQIRVLAPDTLQMGENPLIGEPFSVRRVVYHPDNPSADLPMRLPRFEPGPDGLDFCQMTEVQWQCYQEGLRRVFQAELDGFDPQIIHCQYAWTDAALALETGLPYVIHVWGPELEAAQKDSKFQKLVEQTSMGAGRVLTPDSATAYRLPPEARRTPGRVVLPPLYQEDDASLGARLTEIYLSVLEAWFGA